MVTCTDRVIDIWRAASEPAISIRSISWPHLETFADNCRNIYRNSSGSDEPSELARTAYSLLGNITSAPVVPNNRAINIDELIRRCEAFADSHPDHSLSDPLLRLACAALDLLTERSPLLDAVLDELSNYGCSLDGRPEAVIVVPRRQLIEPVEEFLAAENFTAAVHVPPELRSNIYHYKGIVIVGDIATTFRSLWKGTQRDAREFGWLVTAPPADKVCLINSRGQDLDLNTSWLLPTCRHPNLQPVITVTPAKSVISIPMPYPSPRPVKVSPYFGKGVNAHLIPLFSGRVVYFSEDQGPAPKRIVISETSVSTESCNVERLRKGDLLVLQALWSDLDVIKERADDILHSQYGWVKEDFEQAEQARNQLKDALHQAIDQFGEEKLCQQLCSSGLTRGYSQQLLRNLVKPEYICPIEKGFVPLVEAIDASDLCFYEDKLRKLQTAHRLAGKTIKKELDQLLTEDDDWSDDIDAKGFAKVDGDHLGILLIEVAVDSINSETLNVPMTHLGRVIEANTGQPYLPTSGGKG